MSGSKPHVFKSKYKTKCPCGKKVEFGELDDGRDAIAHHPPHCKEFVEMSGEQYLSYCRKAN